MTDPLKIIASGLCTVETPRLMTFLRDYFSKEEVERVIIGMPVNWDESATHATPLVQKFITAFKKHFPSIPIIEVDERFTSKMAQQAMIDQAKLKIEYCEIKSPIDGRASARMIDPGNIVKENETILVTVQRLDPIYADFTIAENNLPLVRDYMRKGTLKTRVKVPGEP